jgi:hypothetical protein
MTLTRQERERFVLDLYNQGKSTREIAEEARISFRDIGVILNKVIEEKEASKEQAEKVSQSTQAYKLFSEGKSPIQVAIALNIREPEVARFYVEYWKLRQLYSLNKIYEEIKDDIGPFVKLYTLAKVARMDVQNVIRLLETANNDLPAVELRYERSKKEAATLEYEKENSAREFQQVNNQIIMMRKTRDSTRLDCEKEMERLRHLQQERVKQEAIVKHFENSNEVYYIKIRKTAEEKVHSILSNSKMLLKLALLSLTELMRKDPDKFNAFIFCDNKYSSSTTQTRGYSQYYDTVPYGQQQQQQYPSQDCIDVLLEEAEKLYNKLVKELVDESISDYASNILSSLPLLQPPDELQQSRPLLQSPPEGE